MATIARLAVVLTTKTGGFRAGLKRAGSSLAKFASPLAAVGKRVAQFGAILAVGAVAGLVALTKVAFGAIDTLAKLSDRLGVSTEALAGFQLQAQLTGVEAGKIEKSFERMIRNVGQAATGVGEAARTFKQLGLEASVLAQMKTEDQFKAIAEEISKLPTLAAKSAAAYEIFGRAGSQLLPILLGGAAGIEAVRKEAEAFGLTLNRIDAAKIEIANDAVTRLKSIFTGIGRIIAVEVAPVISLVVERFVAWATAGEGVRGKVSSAIKGILKVVGFLADFLHGFRMVWKVFQIAAATAVAAVVAGLNVLVQAAQKTAEFFGFTFVDGVAKSMQLFADATKDTVTELIHELGQLATNLPSAAIEKFWTDAQRGAEGAAEAMAKQGEAMAKVTEAAEDKAKIDKDMEKHAARARAIIESTATSAEKLVAAMEELDVLQAKGLLTPEQFARAAAAAQERFGEKIEQEQKQAKAEPFAPGAVGALQAGSAGAASAIAAFERGQGTVEQIMQTVADTAKEQRDLQRETLRFMQRDPDKLLTLGTSF